MNAVQRALSTFREPPCSYNCAQTVCAAFGRDDLLEQMKACGGGRAPEGTCGALYAAMTLVPERAEAFAAAFRKANGSSLCRELKGTHRVPCQTCVSTVASLVEAETAGACPEA